MPPNDRFKLKKTAVLTAMISALLPATVMANTSAGRVDFAVGGVTAIGSDGTQRALTRGSLIQSGDLIKTTRGRAQIRMSDGAYISLKPNTEFRIDKYNYSEEKPAERKGFFSLLKGGLRTITGLIGKKDRSNYRMKTQVATIGIRGTHYSLDVGADGKQKRTDVVNYLDSSAIILKINPEFALEAGGSASVNPVVLDDGTEVVEVQLVDKSGNRTTYQVFPDGGVVDDQGQALNDEQIAGLLGQHAIDPDSDDLDGDVGDDSTSTLESIIEDLQESSMEYGGGGGGAAPPPPS